MVKSTKPEIPPVTQILQSEEEGNHLKISYKGKIISTKFPDNKILLNDRRIFQIEQLLGPLRSITLIGRIWEKRTHIFNYPFPSGEINMWELQRIPSESVIRLPLNVMDQKLVKLCIRLRRNERERIFVIPLLHA